MTHLRILFKRFKPEKALHKIAEETENFLNSQSRKVLQFRAPTDTFSERRAKSEIVAL